MVKTLDSTILKGFNKRMVNICLSTSKKSGKELRNAHYHLGKLLASQILLYEKLEGKKIAVVIMMRAGLCFGQGIADYLDDVSIVDIIFNAEDNLKYDHYDKIIFADAVINTGKTILDCIELEQLNKIVIATNVISNKHLHILKDYNIYTVRISDNSFKGSNTKFISNGKGPDTGERLFKNKFFER